MGNSAVPAMKVMGESERAKRYRKIAEVHAEIADAKRKSKFMSMPFQLRPEILIHLEEGLAFLAEELLACRSMVDEAIEQHPDQDAVGPSVIEVP